MRKKQVHLTVGDQAHYVVPAFQSISPGDKLPGGFTQIYNRVIDRLLPILSNAAMKSYLALARQAAPLNGFTVTMGYGEIAKITGLARSSVQVGIAELLDKVGCIAVVKEGGMVGSEHQPATYQLLMPVDPPKGAIPSTPVPTDNHRGVPTDRYTPIPVSRYTPIPTDNHTPIPVDRQTCTGRPVGISYNPKTEHTTKAADAAVGAALRELGIGGKNFDRFSKSCVLAQVQGAKRALMVEQSRGEEIENPAGWAIAYLDGEILPRVNPREAKDRAADRERRQALMVTKREYVAKVDQFIQTVDENTFIETACDVIRETGRYNEDARDHFLRTPTRENFQLCEKVYFRLTKAKPDA